MIAVRSVQDVISGAVTVHLPVHFTGKRVEVIVLPLEEDESKATQLQELLLTAPVQSEDELQEFARAREWMEQWTINEF